MHVSPLHTNKTLKRESEEEDGSMIYCMLQLHRTNKLGLMLESLHSQMPALGLIMWHMSKTSLCMVRMEWTVCLQCIIAHFLISQSGDRDIKLRPISTNGTGYANSSRKSKATFPTNQLALFSLYKTRQDRQLLSSTQTALCWLHLVYTILTVGVFKEPGYDE